MENKNAKDNTDMDDDKDVESDEEDDTPDEEVDAPDEEDNTPEEEDDTLDKEDDTPVTWKYKMTFIFKTYWQGIVCIVTPIIFIAILAPFPPQKYQWCAYTLALMAVFWVTECIPLVVTSFLPVLIFPLTGVMSTHKTCVCYMNDTVIMFLGSLMLACAVEQSGLHIRLALFAIKAVGYSHYRLLFAISFITMFVSMWITNTAATTMMVPIIFAVLRVFEEQGLFDIYETNTTGDMIATDMTTCYFCAATFSATIGGIGTLVGTATNLAAKGLFIGFYPDAPEYLSFPLFSGFSIPYMIILEFLLYFHMLVMYFGFLRPNSEAAKKSSIPEEGLEAAKLAVEKNWQQLGKITIWELLVILLFCSAMILFFCRSPQMFFGWGDKISDHFGTKKTKFVQDSAAAILIVFLMLLLPYNFSFFKNFTVKTYEELPDKPIRAIIEWKEMNEILPYSFMFLLGGGFALSEAAKKENSDLNGRISDLLKLLDSLPNLMIILIIITVTVFITNFASNVAVCNVIVPIVMSLAQEININPLWYNIAAGLSASYCFCLPVGTPGNLIVQGAANIPTGKMIVAGIIPTLFTIFITWLAVCFWAPVIWPVLHKSLP